MAAPVASRNVARRWGPGTAAIARLLVATDAPLTGVAIAAAAGVSQPRASQVLSQLGRHEAVRPTDQGYVGRPERLLDLYQRRARPRLTGPDAYWYGLGPAADQARRIADAFSADLAPDLLVPWRHPTLSVVYAGDSLGLEAAGLVPAEGRADATVVVRRTDDRTLLSPARPWPTTAEGIPLADPVQQWWDLLDLGGDDRAEAADRLRRAIVDRTIPRSP